jgi:predicted nucleic acid-binding protein
LIFRDTNVIPETLYKTPNPAVIAWLVPNDAELALPTVSIAEIAFGTGKKNFAAPRANDGRR